MDDEDFWITEIANSPEQDAGLAPLGRVLVWIAAVAVLAIIVALVH